MIVSDGVAYFFNTFCAFEAVIVPGVVLVVCLHGRDHSDVFKSGPGYDSPDIREDTTVVPDAGITICEEKVLLRIDINNDAFAS